MARVVVDNSKELYGSKVSIADLAQFCKMFKENQSDNLDIYQVEDMMSREYKHELESFEYTYAMGCTFNFKDGSVLHVSATADCENPEDLYESYKPKKREF